MNEMTVFSNNEFGTVRTVLIDGEPWFVGKDVAVALGYTDLNHAILDHVDEYDRCNSKTRGQNDPEFGQRGTWLINESGMYSLIFGSKLESAKRFKRWVTSEVLPAIRKTGSYKFDIHKDSYMIDDPIERALRWAEECKERKALESKVNELQPKAKVFDELIDSKLLVNFRDAAKEIGISQSQFTGWLYDNKYIYRNQKGEIRPMEGYMKSGLFQIKPYMNQYNNFTSNRTLITPTGLATFKLIFNSLGHNRDTMKKHGGRKRKNFHGANDKCQS